MNLLSRAPFGIVLTILCVLAIGCGRSDNRTPGQYFKEEQVHTITPNGRIVTDSVDEKGGKIEYKTEDGKKWRVDASKQADGTYQYQYGTPDEIK